jgi:hypothetical protein
MLTTNLGLFQKQIRPILSLYVFFHLGSRSAKLQL